MDTIQNRSWAAVRARGRDRFLLRSIGRAAWGFALASVGIHLILLAVRPMEPWWQALATWGFLTVADGAWMGLHEWNANEEAYGASTEEAAKR